MMDTSILQMILKSLVQHMVGDLSIQQKNKIRFSVHRWYPIRHFKDGIG